MQSDTAHHCGCKKQHFFPTEYTLVISSASLAVHLLSLRNLPSSLVLHITKPDWLFTAPSLLTSFRNTNSKHPLITALLSLHLLQRESDYLSTKKERRMKERETCLCTICSAQQPAGPSSRLFLPSIDWNMSVPHNYNLLCSQCEPHTRIHSASEWIPVPSSSSTSLLLFLCWATIWCSLTHTQTLVERNGSNC